MPVTITISDYLAEELLQWVLDEKESWPKATVYQEHLDDLHKQLDVILPTADDVRGALKETP